MKTEINKKDELDFAEFLRDRLIQSDENWVPNIALAQIARAAQIINIWWKHGVLQDHLEDVAVWDKLV